MSKTDGFEELDTSTIDDQSFEVKEIMGKAPRSILKWGISVIFFSITLIIVGASQISYNDIIKSRVIVTTINPPAYVEARASGRLTDVFVVSEQKVTEGTILAAIESNARLDDVLRLRESINHFEAQNFPTLDSFYRVYPSNLILGSIQPDYNYFATQFQNYLLYQDLQPNKKEILAINEQLKEQQFLLNNQLNQLSLFKKELAISEKGYNRNEKLYENNVLSELDLENSSKAYLAERNKLENIKMAISSTRIVMTNLKSLKLKTETSDIELARKTSQQLDESIQLLKNEISGWEHLYLMKAPINGSIGLFDIWNKNQNVKEGQILFTIVPDSSESIIGKLTMPMQNSGKVKNGQKVIIKLDNYPYQEWGTITGEIINIAAVPKQDEPVYMVYIKIRNLSTSSSKMLEFRQEMQGSAEIVTEELNVLQRIFYQFRKIWR